MHKQSKNWSGVQYPLNHSTEGEMILHVLTPLIFPHLFFAPSEINWPRLCHRRVWIINEFAQFFNPFENHTPFARRGALDKMVRRYACQTSKNLTLSIPIFALSSTHQYSIFNRKATNFFFQIWCFYHNLIKIHPIYVFWTPSSLIKTHQSLYQISRNSTPKGRYIYYRVNLRTPTHFCGRCGKSATWVYGFPME